MKYCPNCKFETDDSNFVVCPYCGTSLLMKSADNNKPNINLGDGSAVNGSITSVVNNYIQEKSAKEKHEENVKTFRQKCLELCVNGLLLKERKKELESLRVDLDLSEDEAFAILSDVKQISKKQRKELPLEGRLRVEKTIEVIHNNNKEKLYEELNSLRQWKQEYDVEELDQLYYQLFAILIPDQYIKELEKSTEDDYWQSYWAVVAYNLLHLSYKASGKLAHLKAWDNIYPPQNTLLVATASSLMQCDELTAKRIYKEIHPGYSECLKPLANTLNELMNMNWEREQIEQSNKFYFDSLFKEYCTICQKHADEVAATRVAQEEAERIKKQAEALRQNNINMLLDSANELFEKSNYTLAKTKYQQVLKLDSNNSIALAKINKIDVFLAQQESELQKRFDDAMSIGDQAMNTKNYAEAIANYKKAIEYKPKDTKATAKLAAAKKENNRNGFNDWWLRNRKWILLVLLLCLIGFVGYKTYGIIKNNIDIAKHNSIEKQQKEFNELANTFNNICKQELSYKNAYESLVIENNILQKILNILKTNMEIKSEPRNYYISCHVNRVKDAIIKINNAVYEPGLSDTQRKSMIQKYLLDRYNINNLLPNSLYANGNDECDSLILDAEIFFINRDYYDAKEKFMYCLTYCNEYFESVCNQWIELCNDSIKAENERVLASAEDMPEFPGGTAKLFEYINKNLKYPQLARESDIQGKVIVNFVVEKDGSISNVKVLRGIGGGCDEEAIRVVQNLPKFKPGKQRGKPVRVTYAITINFILQ